MSVTDEWTKRRSPISTALVVAAACALFDSILYFGFGLDALAHELRRPPYTRAQGTVIDVSVVPIHLKYYQGFRPEVRYQFTAGGQIYSGSELCKYTFRQRILDRRSEDAAKAEFHPGDRIDVMYNPTDPGDEPYAVVPQERTPPISLTGVVGAAAMFVVVAAGALVAGGFLAWKAIVRVIARPRA